MYVCVHKYHILLHNKIACFYSHCFAVMACWEHMLHSIFPSWLQIHSTTSSFSSVWPYRQPRNCLDWNWITTERKLTDWFILSTARQRFTPSVFYLWKCAESKQWRHLSSDSDADFSNMPSHDLHDTFDSSQTINQLTNYNNRHYFFLPRFNFYSKVQMSCQQYAVITAFLVHS